MRETTCCFWGHNWLPHDKIASIFLKLDEEIEKLIQAGVCSFLSGGKMGFDRMAASLIADRKSRGYDVHLKMLLSAAEDGESRLEGEEIHHQLLLSKAGRAG